MPRSAPASADIATPVIVGLAALDALFTALRLLALHRRRALCLDLTLRRLSLRWYLAFRPYLALWRWRLPLSLLDLELALLPVRLLRPLLFYRLSLTLLLQHQLRRPLLWVRSWHTRLLLHIPLTLLLQRLRWWALSLLNLTLLFQHLPRSRLLRLLQPALLLQ